MAHLDKAIHAINIEAQFKYTGEDADTIEWINGTSPISKEDILAKQSELNTEEVTAEAQLATDKTNGNQKLLDLGLSQAEVDAITK